MNLRRLKYFVKIVDIGSLTPAAWDRLPMSTIFTKYFSRLKFILPPVRNALPVPARIVVEGFARCLPVLEMRSDMSAKRLKIRDSNC